MSPETRKSRFWVTFAAVLTVLLFGAGFTLSSLRVPFSPHNWSAVVIFWALSTLIIAALFVFGMILARTLFRLWMERRAMQPGSRFKTKMVLSAMAISLLPLAGLFVISYGLMNRTLDKWFPLSLETANSEMQQLLSEGNHLEYLRLNSLANRVSEQASVDSRSNPNIAIETAARLASEQGAEGVWATDAHDVVISTGDPLSSPIVVDPTLKRSGDLEGGGELWESRSGNFLAARAPLGSGWLVVAHRLPPDFAARNATIEQQNAIYEQEHQENRVFKRQMQLTLLFLTILLLFAATWFALSLAKQVTVPIQALAEATREIAAGHFDTQVQVKAQDEVNSLVHSFNEMTAQLSDSRRQIDDFTRNLQQAVQELDHRRMLIETVLENIPTGVLTLNTQGAILRMNTAARQIFSGGASADAAPVTAANGEGGNGNAVNGAANGTDNGHGATLGDLAGSARARDIQHLVRRAQRMGTASKELQFHMRGRVVHAAVTVSPLGPRTANGGYVVVIDDLTELLRAQKVAAWQEVAQRIAHEIRNPLTPIQLSAERLSRYLLRHSENDDKPGLANLVSECSALIGREVGILEALVNEFSQFARFPVARLAPADPNEIVNGALEVFHGRLGDVYIDTDFAADLPPIKADAELLRRVIVNLIDNAAEAMEGAPDKSLRLSTRFLPEHDTVEISVADSGAGISPEDKDKLFLPHFSTKERGTGLGLAIASRIIAEHHGMIRAEDNLPSGARFVIEVPTAEAMSAALAES